MHISFFLLLTPLFFTEKAFAQFMPLTMLRPGAVDPCAAPSPAIGSICSDGSQYAGLTPDGNVKMYIMRCNLGQSWNGSACTGTETTVAWSSVTQLLQTYLIGLRPMGHLFGPRPRV